MHIYQATLNGRGVAYQIETANGDKLILFKHANGNQELFVYKNNEVFSSLLIEKEEVGDLTSLLSRAIE